MADRRAPSSRMPVYTPGRAPSIGSSHATSSLSDYRVLQQLGKGSFGTVSKITRLADGEAFVWKEVGYRQMDIRDKSQLVREVNLLKDLKHPHIVRYVDRIIDKASMRLFIIMQYCVGGDLDQVLKRHSSKKEYLSEDTVLKIFSQLVDAVAYCHSRKPKILHRDIKPSNVFLDEKQRVKLGDFGLARFLEEGRLASTNVGTPYYQSPEIVMGKEYDDKSDIWALGCILYELSMLEIPFQATTYQALSTLVQKGTYRPVSSSYGPDLRHLVNWTLRKDPAERPTTAELAKTQVLEWRINQSHALEKTEDNSKTRKLRPVPRNSSRVEKKTSDKRYESHTPRYTQRQQDRASPCTRRDTDSNPPHCDTRVPGTKWEDETCTRREHAFAPCVLFRNIATPCRAVSKPKRAPPAYPDENLAPPNHTVTNSTRTLTVPSATGRTITTSRRAPCDQETQAPLHRPSERAISVHSTPYPSDISRNQRLPCTPTTDTHQVPRPPVTHHEQTSVAKSTHQPGHKPDESVSTIEEKTSFDENKTASATSRERKLLHHKHELRKQEIAVRFQEQKLAKREEDLRTREKTHTRDVAHREEILRAREQSLHQVEAALRRREERLRERVHEIAARATRDGERAIADANDPYIIHQGPAIWTRHTSHKAHTIMEAEKLPKRKTPQSVVPTLTLCGMPHRSQSLVHFGGRGHSGRQDNMHYIARRAF